MNVNDLAIEFMEKYLSDGKVRKPSDFDEDILGMHFDVGVLTGDPPIWNDTVFCKALGHLVDSGKVKFWQDENLICYYQINEGGDT